MADITEREAFNCLLDSLQRCRDASRSLALLRSDEDWLRVAMMMDGVKENVTRLMHRPASKRGRPILWTPPMAS